MSLFDNAEKFSLRWNNFQSNLSKTFSSLRSEDEFYDVTLVSDDQEMISAHKLVLSASSPYFKHILTQTKHSHPLLCLQGVDSRNLQTVLDYIYQGQVEVGHENLERFLSIAAMFELEGLTAKNKVVKEEKIPGPRRDEEIEEDDEIFSSSEEEIQDIHPVELDEDLEDTSQEDITETVEEKVAELENSLIVSSSNSMTVESSNIEEVEQKILENIEVNSDGSHSCKVCGKKSTRKSARTIIRQHIETHLEGTSFPCQHCPRTFR